MLKIIVLALIPGIMLIVQNGMNLNRSSELLGKTVEMKQNVLSTFELGSVVHKLQIERGTSVMYISSDGDSSIKTRLLSAYSDTDQSLSQLSRWVVLKGATRFNTRGQYHQWIKDYRRRFNKLNSTVEEVIGFYTAQINAFVLWVVDTIKLQQDSTIWTELVAFYMLLVGKEQTGIERALGSIFYSKGEFALEEILWYREHEVLGRSFLGQSWLFSSNVGILLKREYETSLLNNNLEAMRIDILRNKSNSQSVTQGIIWFDNMTEYIDILQAVQGYTTRKISEHIDAETSRLKLDLVSSILQMTATLILVPSIVLLISKISKRLSSVADELQLKTVHLQNEQKRTESLLSQIVPKTVARKLKLYCTVRPELYDSVTVLYGDLYDFSSLCNQASPTEVIQMLNTLEKEIEERLDAYNVNRIGTLGNAFLVTAGLPEKIGNHHSNIIARLSLDLIESLRQLHEKQNATENLKLRIGVSSGPVLAGVVGKGVPRYCIIGKTVTEALKMEETCLPMCIQITETTYRNLEKYSNFTFTENTGRDGCMYMKSYWLTKKTDGHTATSSEGAEKGHTIKFVHSADGFDS